MIGGVIDIFQELFVKFAKICAKRMISQETFMFKRKLFHSETVKK